MPDPTTPIERAAEADYLGRCGWTDDARALWAAHPQVHESWQYRMSQILDATLTDPDDPDALARALYDSEPIPDLDGQPVTWAALRKQRDTFMTSRYERLAAAVRAWLLGDG